MALSTIVPSIIAIPCFLIAGIKYKYVKEQMTLQGKINEKTKEEEKCEARYDKFGGREFDVMQAHLHSESINFSKFTKTHYELSILDALTQSTKRKKLIDQTVSGRLFRDYLKEDRNMGEQSISVGQFTWKDDQK